MRPVQFVDARDVAPLRLGQAALEWLVQHKHLRLSAGSPLHFLVDEESPSTKQAQEAAVQAFKARGLHFGGTARPAPEPALLLRALEVLAQPERELSVEQHSGAEDGSQPPQLWFLRGDEVARLAYVTQGVEVYAAHSRDLLATALSKLLVPSVAPQAFEPVSLTRAQVQAAAQVWGGQASAPVPRSTAVERLCAAGLPRPDAEQLLASLVEAQVATESGKALTLTAAARTVFEPVWNGQSVELLIRDLPLEPLEGDEEPDEREGSLLVVGAPGSRLIVDTLPADLLSEDSETDSDADSGEEADDDALQFSWLTREELQLALAALLELDAP
jgi:hypothetical protein